MSHGEVKKKQNVSVGDRSGVGRSGQLHFVCYTRSDIKIMKLISRKLFFEEIIVFKY
jgi:hypothetical protein